MPGPSIQSFRSSGETLPRPAINHQSVTLLYSIEKRRLAENLRNGDSDRLPQKIVHPLGCRMVCGSRCARRHGQHHSGGGRGYSEWERKWFSA